MGCLSTFDAAPPKILVDFQKKDPEEPPAFEGTKPSQGGISVAPPKVIRLPPIIKNGHQIQGKADPPASERDRKAAELIQSRFSVVGRLKDELKDLTYTSENLIEFAQTIIKFIVRIGRGQTEQNKLAVKEIFSPQNIKQIEQNKKYFGDLLKQLKKEQISPATSSRIYHQIANIKKALKKANKTKKNQYDLQVEESYDYASLQDEQVDEVVKLEIVGAQIQKLGKTIKFKLDQIRKEAKAISLILSDTFAKYADFLSQLRFDLSTDECMSMAQVSREACDYYDNGVFLLVIYFVKSCSCLETQKQTVAQIQSKMNAAIAQISKKYPPGEGLSSSAQTKEQLGQIELKKQQFKSEAHILQPNDRQAQLEKIIEDNARIAKEMKPLFQTLVKSTCLEESLFFKLGLKYNVDNPNPKAITRIIEKMLFKKEKEEGQPKSKVKNIGQQLDREDQEYRRKIQEKLQHQESVTFTISDMVRGKCVFGSIQSIIAAVYKIKQFVKSNPSDYRLIEVESRFNNPIPISDVTLKIALQQKTVAELQLTLQTNAATYTFAHKIYEFSRSKVFSKIKVVDNYHKEFKLEIAEMISRKVRLAEGESITKQASLIKQAQNIRQYKQQIIKYFDLKSDKEQSFRHILEKQLFKVKDEIGEGLLCVDGKMQDMILPVFCMHIGEWGVPLGERINNTLQVSHSDLFKSTLIYFLYSQIDPERDFQSIKQFYNTRGKQLDQLQKDRKIRGPLKLNVKDYILNVFGIKDINIYHNNNAKTYYKFSQLYTVIGAQRVTNGSFNDNSYTINLIFGEYSKETIAFLINTAKVTLLRRKPKKFLSYCQWAIRLVQRLDEENAYKAQKLALIHIMMAENYLQSSQAGRAEKLLTKIVAFFRENEDYQREVECELMLVECKLKQEPKSQEYKGLYLKMLEKVNVRGMPYRGKTLGKTEWRIALNCWDRAYREKNQSMKKEALDKHYRRAISLASIEQVMIMSKTISWSAFEKEKLPNPQLRKHDETSVIDLRQRYFDSESYKIMAIANMQLTKLFLNQNRLSKGGCQHLGTANWPNLSQLELAGNTVYDGCQHLSKANWPNLARIKLERNHIDSSGCYHLSKANWLNLNSFDIYWNRIGDQGCRYLSTASWPNLTQIDLADNQIGSEGCLHIATANWPNLSRVNIGINKIGKEGCQHLAKANWPNLTQLRMRASQIGHEGCQYLTTAKWPNLRQLNLGNNKIGSEDCLSKANWPNLTELALDDNKLGNEGCQHLATAKWPSLSQLNLDSNDIKNEGCQNLSKASWPKLTKISLDQNKLTADDKKVFQIAGWPKQINIWI